MIAVDFFCGAGGLTRGLLNAGIDVVAGVDADEACRQTYETNNSPAKFLCADVRELTVLDLRKHLGTYKSRDLLLAACAPCQPFSKHKKSPESDDLSTLLLEFARFVKAMAPSQVLIENVPGITKVPGYSTYRRFLKTLTDLRYRIKYGVVDAKYYGVAQTRRRFILLAMKRCEPSFPEPTHGSADVPFVTVRDVISSFPRIRAGKTHPSIPNHSASELIPLNLERIRHCPKDGGDRRSWPARLTLDCHTQGHIGHTDVYGRMWWDRPAPALTCKCVSLSNGRYGHPEQNRAISLREAAAIQSFCDTYEFFGPSRGHVAQQVGNAVPVALASAFAAHIVRLRRMGSKKESAT